MTSDPSWGAEGRFSLTSFTAELMRTDQGILEDPSFAMNDEFLKTDFWMSARQSAQSATDHVWASTLPEGMSLDTRAKLFHERFHFAQISTYPIFQMQVLTDLERLRRALLEFGGRPDFLCGLDRWDSVADAITLQKNYDAQHTLMFGTPNCSTQGLRTAANVNDAGIVDARLVGDRVGLRGYAGVLRFESQWQIVSFSMVNLVESAAHVAEHLFCKKPIPRLRALATAQEIRYVGCWEVWCRLNSRSYPSEHELASAFLAAVDLALGAHTLSALR